MNGEKSTSHEAASRSGPVALALAGALFLALPAAADEAGGITLGFGQLTQTRQDVDSKGWIGEVGFAGRINDDTFIVGDFQFAIDAEHSDLTHLSLTVTGGYALGPEWFTYWIGGGIRLGLDGYPNPSFSYPDLGLATGVAMIFGGYGFGADVRGWLGWNWYCDRATEEISMGFDPYLEWRVYVIVGF